MKLQLNGQEFFELTPIQKKVICNDIHEDEFDADMKRRLQYILEHKYEQCFNRLKKEWDEKLKDRVDSVPTNPEEYAKYVFSQPDYFCRKTREIKSKK